MKRPMLLIISAPLLLSVCLFGCTAGPVDTTAEAEAGIAETNARFMAAAGEADAAGVAEQYTEDGQLLPPNGPVVSGRDAIREFWSAGLAPGGGATLESDEIRGFGDVAHEVGHYTLTAPDGSIADQGKYIVVWKRVDGGWKLHRDIWNSSLPLPAPAAETEEAESDD